MALARKFTDQLQLFCQQANELATLHTADALLFLMERPTDWAKLREAVGKHPVLLAGDSVETLAGASADDFKIILVNKPPESPVFERLTQALLESVANEYVPPGATIVAVYSGFEPTVIDTISIIRLGEHLGQLTMRDLRQLKTRIPFDTLKIVVDLAVDIGREGREGKPVGTLFVVGDHRKVLSFCRPMGFDPGPRLQPRGTESRRTRKSARASRKSPRSTARSSSRATPPSSRPASTSPRRERATSRSPRASARATGPPPKSAAPPAPSPSS